MRFTRSCSCFSTVEGFADWTASSTDRVSGLSSSAGNKPCNLRFWSGLVVGARALSFALFATNDWCSDLLQAARREEQAERQFQLRIDCPELSDSSCTTVVKSLA